MKIDLNTIEGYEGMTPEAKLAALEGYDFDTSELETLRETVKSQKGLIDKYTGEIGSLKKKQCEGLTESERKSKEQEAALRDLQEKYELLKKNNVIAEYMSKYLELGFDKELARQTAEACAEGNMDRVFENLAKFKADEEKRYKAEAAKNTPKPDGRGTVVYKSVDEIMKIKDPSERQKAIAENLELFE